jgi:predicted Fe-Mo cluster-binding NifX family protein
MKVVVSARGTAAESEVDPRFGRASYFLLFDTENGSCEPVENVQALSAAHGAGIQAAETVCRQCAEVLITGHVGPKAFAVLSAAGLKVYRGDGRSVNEAIEAFRNGRLTEVGGATK